MTVPAVPRVIGEVRCQGSHDAVHDSGVHSWKLRVPGTLGRAPTLPVIGTHVHAVMPAQRLSHPDRDPYIMSVIPSGHNVKGLRAGRGVTKHV